MNGKTPKPPRNAGLRFLFRILTILCLLLLTCFSIWRVALHREINGRLQKIRASGFPASGQELNEWRPQVPDAENAALVLTQAFALLRTFPEERAAQIEEIRAAYDRSPWLAETQTLVADYLALNADALAKVHEALERPRCRFPADFAFGAEVELPHLAKLRDLVRVAALRGRLDAHDPANRRWGEHVRLMLQSGATLDEEPAVLSQLVKMAILRDAVRTTEHGLTLSGLEPVVCEQLTTAFALAEKTNALSLAMMGERAIMIPMFRLSWSDLEEVQHLAEKDKPPHRYSGKPNPFLWLSGFFERDLNFYLCVMETNLHAASLPPPQSLTTTNDRAVFDKAWAGKYLLSGMIAPTLAKCFVRDARAHGYTRVAIAALAVESFRTAHGRLPADLTELTPRFLASIPTDPFDGAPLRYRTLSKGYMVYSIDADGHDDGGREPPRPQASQDTNSYDLTFVVER